MTDDKVREKYEQMWEEACEKFSQAILGKQGAEAVQEALVNVFFIALRRSCIEGWNAMAEEAANTISQWHYKKGGYTELAETIRAMKED